VRAEREEASMVVSASRGLALELALGPAVGIDGIELVAKDVDD
jgi:hypothetical protein